MPAGKRAELRAAEVDRLRRWCFVFLDSMAEMHGYVVLFDALRKIIERCTTVRGMRSAARDCLEWAKGLSPSERNVIDRKLRSAFGKGLDAGVADEQGELGRVVRRGRIANEREYRLVQARIEEIYVDGERKAEVKELDALLAGFRPS